MVDSISAGLAAPTASGAGIAASTLSPKISNEIGQYFKGKDAEGSTAHILAHTILGAVVAATGGNNALTAGIAAGGAEAAAPLLSQYLYDKDAKDLTASEKSTISSIVGLAGSAVGATTGDVSSTVQSGQSAQNAVENNYQTKATLKVVNKQLEKCSPSDRGCIERGISALRKADKILDNHFKTCAQTNDASCVKNHLEQILASDASPEMKETIQLLKQLGISTETMGLLNETSGYSQKETQLVEDARAGKDLGCISGTTQNCIAPISEKTLGGKVGTVINDMTVRQLAAVLGAKFDPLTGEEITPKERQDAKVGMLGLGFTKTVSGVTRVSDEVLATVEKKYGSEIAKKLETETYFRVEGGGSGTKSSMNRITVNSDQTISINSGCSGQLCVSTNGPSHALYYISEKRPNGQIIVFEIDKVLHQKILSEAITQKPIPGIPRNPNAPKIVDETKGQPSINLELPKVWDRLLEENSSKARVLTQKEFENEFKR